MFAVYAKEANFNDPLASVVVGERPDPIVEDGWVRVEVTHASLNRHDIFTLRGMTSQEEPIPFPMILGNDAAGLLEDGTPVVLYPVMGTDSWKGDETIDPHWHVISELVPAQCFATRYGLAHGLPLALHQISTDPRPDPSGAGSFGRHVHGPHPDGSGCWLRSVGHHSQ